MEKLVNKGVVLFILSLFLTLQTYSQRGISNRKVNISFDQVSIEQAIFKLGKAVNTNFSYNADQLPVDQLINKSYTRQNLTYILKDLLGDDIELIPQGNHIIIRIPSSNQPQKVKFEINGTIKDIRTGNSLSNITVYIIDDVKSTKSSVDGSFSISSTTEQDYIEISFGSTDYKNKIEVLKTKEQHTIDISLSPRDVEKVKGKQIVQINARKDIDDIGFVKLMVPKDHFKTAADLEDYYETRWGQISVWPKIGTNHEVSGIVENKLSFNLIAGYSGGVEGFELGGVLNVVEKDVTGVQIGGVGNIIGEELDGVQIAGVFNHNLGRVNGTQISGFSNTVLDTLFGTQFAGFSNVMTGDMKGLQMSGFSNVNTGIMEGWQFSGFSNVVADSARGLQFAGFLNYGKHMIGHQLAGFANISTGNSEGLQFAGFSNVTTGNLNGVQISAFLNYAKKIKGHQFGIINIADTIDGYSFGILNIIKKGYLKTEFYHTPNTDVSFNFKSGTLKFYNIIRLSFKEYGDFNKWSYGFGMGSSQRLWGKWLNSDINLTTNVVNFNNRFNPYFNLLNTLDANLSVKLIGPIHLFGGPSLNYYIYDQNLTPERSEFIKYSTPGILGKYRTDSWLGYQIGIRI